MGPDGKSRWERSGSQRSHGLALDGDVVVATDASSGDDKFEETCCGFVECFAICVEDDFWICGFLVGRVDSRKFGDFAVACALVEAFDVSRFAGCQRCIHVDFEELDATFERDFTGTTTIGLIGGDERGHDDDAGVGHELGNFGDASNVFGSVFVREAEVCVEAVAYVVSVEHVDLIAEVEEFALEVA